jgi:hypothetical protein
MNAPFPVQQPQNSQKWIQTAETQRDLKAQLAGLGQEDMGEIQFIEWNPGRVYVTLWNRQSGDEITLPRYQALAALNTPNPRGGWMWTTHRYACECGQCSPEMQSPKQRVGTVKCFLHPDAPEREVLDEIGIAQLCNTMFLNESAKRQHAKRHPSLWAQYQEEIQLREKMADKAAQADQTAAILALAAKPERAAK